MANEIQLDRSTGSAARRSPLAIALALTLGLGLSAIATSAQAGGHGWYGGHGWNHGRGWHRYDRAYHRGYRHGRRYRHSNRGAYLAGGILLGSVITHALTQPRRERVVEYRTERIVEPVRVFRTRSYDEGFSDRVSGRDSGYSRRLFRDRDGNCFEREVSESGDELLIELPADDCRW